MDDSKLRYLPTCHASLPLCASLRVVRPTTPLSPPRLASPTRLTATTRHAVAGCGLAARGDSVSRRFAELALTRSAGTCLPSKSLQQQCSVLLLR